ncbi:MAG TPA: SDR family NAD(P)-dependent oxidoreductase, partial [Dongiaceae bacterium]
RSDSQITVLVNNAGIATMGPLAQANIDQTQRVIDLNITAFTRIATAAAPVFVTRQSGTIINIASVAALAPELTSAVYSASKAYVLAFTQAMQHELSAQGIQVQAVLPGATRTEIWERAGTPVDQLPQEIVMPVDEMVDAALTGLDQGELITIPSLPDAADWERFNNARLALGPNLSRNAAAARYKTARTAAA